MQGQNPQIDVRAQKKQTIEEYINENLHLKTLKIKKFSFQNTASCEIKTSGRYRNCQTARYKNNISEDRQSQNFNKWEPKISHRKILNQPKILLSVQRRKIKTSESHRKNNNLFSTPHNRLGFKGQKVKANSFYIQKFSQKIPQRIVIHTAQSKSTKKQKYIPNLQFNLNYILTQRRRKKEVEQIDRIKKIGSNKGYFAFFSSDNFTKYLENNSNSKKDSQLTQNHHQFNKTNERRYQALNRSHINKNQFNKNNQIQSDKV